MATTRCPCCGGEHLPGEDECPDCGSSLTQDDLPHPRTVIERSLAEDRVRALNPAVSVTVPASTSLAQAVGIMRDKRIGCVLATDPDGRLAGILSERDLLNKVAGAGVDLQASTVEAFMTASPETIHREDLLASALQRMMVGDHRHLPLVDGEGRPAGIISSRDIINYLESLLHRSGVAPAPAPE